MKNKKIQIQDFYSRSNNDTVVLDRCQGPSIVSYLYPYLLTYLFT